MVFHSNNIYRYKRGYMRCDMALLIAVIVTLAVLFSRPMLETWGATPTGEGAVQPISMEVKLRQSRSDLLLDVQLTSNLERPVQVSRSFLPWAAWWSMVLIGVEDRGD